MSMKRSKQSSGARGRDAEGAGSLFAPKVAPPDPAWADQVEGKPDEAFIPYALATRFEKGALVTHPKFGKGYVKKVDGARIEVRFQDADRTLGHAG